MQYFGKWYKWDPNDENSDYRTQKVLKDFFKMGFVDYYTHGYIAPAKVNYAIDSRTGETYPTHWEKFIKWKEDVNSSIYFNVYFPYNNSYPQRLFLRERIDKNNYCINQQLSCRITYYDFCIQHITLANGGFLLDICQGPSFGNNLPETIPPFSMNITYDTVHPSDSYGTIVGVSPFKDSQSSEFLYFGRGMWYYPGSSHEHPEKRPWNNIFYNKKCDNITVYNDEQGSRTINTNISNKYIMTKIPHFDGFLDNIYLMTSKPTSLQVNDYFTINNKTYLLLFNNFVVEVAQ